MISISRAGSMRCPVIIVGRFAFKFARDQRGRASNLYEAKLYRSVNATRRALLCPVIWVSRNGFLQIMRAAKPRADMMSLRHRDFVAAARAAGASNGRIIFRHLLPNVLGPVVVLASLSIGNIIILESALSFLGLGVKPPTASWGGMLADGRAYIRTYPHICLVPGLAITITVLAFNLLGDGVRDALDSRQRD